MTLHKTGSLAVTNIALEREGRKKKKKKRRKSCYNTGYSYLVTHPSMNLSEQGVTLLSGRDAVLSLRYCCSTLDVFLSQKVTKTGRITYIAWENKERKNRNENEKPIMLTLLIGQEAVLSL